MPNHNAQMWTAEGKRPSVRVDENAYINHEGNKAYLVYGYAGYLSGTVSRKYGLWAATLGDGDVYYYITRDEAIHRITDLCDL